jgi:sterol desaturase/sphingolipid hydroxylase (fatty acid hydroxylase superfamily)
VLAWSIFPVIFGGALLLATGVAPHLGAPTAFVVAKLAATAAIIAGERLLPYRREWNRSHGDLGTDLLHGIFSGIGTTAVIRVIVQAAGIALAGALSRTFGTGLWPSHWPFAAQLVLAALLAEFIQYWLHRWQHEHDALWRFHAVHHSVPRLYWLNATRSHPLDLALVYILPYVPLIALGAPETTIMLLGIFEPVLGMLQHSNIAMRLGPLNYVFNAAEPHRWHHSAALREANHNYGSNLLVWDLVFGTFHLPPERGPEAVGIATMPDFPRGFGAQMLVPFRWTRFNAETQSAQSTQRRFASEPPPERQR